MGNFLLVFRLCLDRFDRGMVGSYCRRNYWFILNLSGSEIYVLILMKKYQKAVSSEAAFWCLRGEIMFGAIIFQNSEN